MIEFTFKVSLINPVIIPRAEHGISRQQISDKALKVLYRLHEAGFRACLVGGCVRDLLLGLRPKDFDVATDARPEQVREVFDNCRLIGRRFRLAHVHFGRDIIEVATFRGQDAAEDDADDARLIDDSKEGRIVRDNVYGTLEEDVWRRDFTVNALYYDIANFSIIDYVNGMQDLQAGVIKLIGDPEARFHEDPVRLLRAVRFTAKLGFVLDPATEKQVLPLASLLAEMPKARLYDEVLKLFQSGHAVRSLVLLRQYDLFRHLFPLTEACLQHDGELLLSMLNQALSNTDARVASGRGLNPAFLYSVMLWAPMMKKAGYAVQDASPIMVDLQDAAGDVLDGQASATAMPRRYSAMVREIWAMQPRLERYQGQRALLQLSSPAFRAGYDFLCLRAPLNPVLAERAAWWTELQEQNPVEQKNLAQALIKEKSDKPRRRRRVRRER